MAKSSKTCTRCKETLLLSAFHKCKAAKDGLNWWCISCQKETSLDYYYSNQEAMKLSMTQARHKRKKEVYDYYGAICVCCGEADPIFLTIDHINNDGAKHRKKLGNSRCSSDAVYRSIIRNGFPDTFQILCMNCNWAKSRGGCPHQNKSKLSFTQS